MAKPVKYFKPGDDTHYQEDRSGSIPDKVNEVIQSGAPRL
jgi:hypothetical protein